MMALHLYEVAAEAGAGKTTLINRIFRSLIKDFGAKRLPAAEIVGGYGADTAKIISHVQAVMDGTTTTVQNYITIVEANGKKVGCYTAGDYPMNIRDALYFFDSHDCDIGIFARHPNGRHKRCMDEMLEIIKRRSGKTIVVHDLLGAFGVPASGIKTQTDIQIKDMVNKIIR